MSADDAMNNHQREAIRRTLRAAREHLGLDVAFVSQLTDHERRFLFVDAKDEKSSVCVGGSDPLEASYCHYVVNGEVPQFLPDPNAHPVTAGLPVTTELPVGTHLSVPIEFSDGRIYGTFCCFSGDLRPEVEAADLRTMRVMAALVGGYLEDLDAKQREKAERRRAIMDVLRDPRGLSVVFQPLVDLASETIVAVEALSRFANTDKGPIWFFREADAVGLGPQLELKAVRAALSAFDDIPAPVRLNINVSPGTLTTPAFSEMLHNVPADRLVVEVTEHAAVEDHEALKAAREHLTSLGVAMSIDDVGAGFSGLSRILETGADELKMDRSIVCDVHRDPVKQAMIGALVGFCERTGFALVAEGIETPNELAALCALGVRLGQGYHFAKPAPLEAFFPSKRQGTRSSLPAAS